jgi:hypothetical protein
MEGELPFAKSVNVLMPKKRKLCKRNCVKIPRFKVISISEPFMMGSFVMKRLVLEDSQGNQVHHHVRNEQYAFLTEGQSIRVKFGEYPNFTTILYGVENENP